MASEKSDSGNGSGAAPETPKGKPSEKQMNLLAIIMQNIEDQPKINVSTYLSPPPPPPFPTGPKETTGSTTHTGQPG